MVIKRSANPTGTAHGTEATQIWGKSLLGQNLGIPLSKFPQFLPSQTPNSPSGEEEEIHQPRDDGRQEAPVL